MNRLSYECTKKLLEEFDKEFSPCLSSKLDLSSYCAKLSENAMFLLCTEKEHRIGYIAFYENRTDNFVYITSFCIKKDYRGKSIAQDMIKELCEYSKKRRCKKIILEVRCNNERALHFYKKVSFHKLRETDKNTFVLSKSLS